MIKPWHNYEFDGQTSYRRPYLSQGGGVPIMYLDDNGGSNGSNHGAYSPNSSFTGTPNDLQVPDVYGKPGTDFEGNLNNTIFALWADYYNDSKIKLVTITVVVKCESKDFGTQPQAQ